MFDQLVFINFVINSDIFDFSDLVQFFFGKSHNFIDIWSIMSQDQDHAANKLFMSESPQMRVFAF